MSKIYISPTSIIWIAVLFIFNNSHIIELILAIALHELGHIICAMILKVKIHRFELSILGARLHMAGDISYLQEFLISLCGPLSGVIGFALCIHHDFLFDFAILSLCLSVFNLLPLSTLDGGRILNSLLCMIFPLSFTGKIMQLSTFFTLFCLWLLSVYILIKNGGALSMLVFSSIFFAKCFIFDNKNGDFNRF